MSKIKFTTDIDLDEQKINRELSERFEAITRNRINKFFNETSIRRYNAQTGIHQFETELGDGLKQIDDFITEKFCSDEFRQRAEKFANENWERIFEECLTKALQHKANAIAFATAKDLNPRSSKV